MQADSEGGGVVLDDGAGTGVAAASTRRERGGYRGPAGHGAEKRDAGDDAGRTGACACGAPGRGDRSGAIFFLWRFWGVLVGIRGMRGGNRGSRGVLGRRGRGGGVGGVWGGGGGGMG